jgi:bifunctional non-homologous end joining protein LigD
MPQGIEPSNLDKVFWPEDGLTKGDLIAYFESISRHVVPALKDRPLTLKRYPDGIDGFSFFQKNTPSYAPEWIRTATYHAGSAKRDVAYVLCNDKRTLLWLANQAAVELHPWLSRIDRIERPDHLVFDLDPPEGKFEVAVEVAPVVRDVLREHGLDGLPKTSGAKGIHVYVPLQRRHHYGEVRAAAAALSHLVEERVPELTTTEFHIAERGGRLFLDAGRNAPGAHVVAPYSPRARPGAPVSFPVEWKDLARVHPGDFTIKNVPDLLSKHGDLWKKLMPGPQSLAQVRPLLSGAASQG